MVAQILKKVYFSKQWSGALRLLLGFGSNKTDPNGSIGLWVADPWSSEKPRREPALLTSLFSLFLSWFVLPAPQQTKALWRAETTTVIESLLERPAHTKGPHPPHKVEATLALPVCLFSPVPFLVEVNILVLKAVHHLSVWALDAP